MIRFRIELEFQETFLDFFLPVNVSTTYSVLSLSSVKMLRNPKTLRSVVPDSEQAEIFIELKDFHVKMTRQNLNELT